MHIYIGGFDIRWSCVVVNIVYLILNTIYSELRQSVTEINGMSPTYNDILYDFFFR